MSEVLLVGALLVGIVVLTPLAERWRVPLPVLLTIFGLSFYNDYIFYGIYTVLAVIVAAVNCK